MENNQYYIGSFATKNTVYEEIVNKCLIDSIKKLDCGLNYEIKYIDNLGTWSKNVAQKPRIILECLEERQADLVFLDADSELVKPPDLFLTIPKEFDIALHYLDHDSWYKNNTHRKELLSGTLYLRNSTKIKDLCREWYKKASTTTKWEQIILQEILEKRSDIKIYPLPIEYCWIKTLPNGQDPFIKCEPVVLHNQVSRQTKRSLI